MVEMMTMGAGLECFDNMMTKACGEFIRSGTFREIY
jgi:hypothetical protein